MEKLQIIVDDYNKLLFDGMEEYFAGIDAEEEELMAPGNIESIPLIHEAIEKWNDTVIDEIGTTPREFMAGLETGDVLSCIRMFAEESDFSFPAVLKDRVEEKKTDLEDFLLCECIDLLRKFSDGEQETTTEEMIVLIEYAGILSSWDCQQLLRALLTAFDEIDVSDYIKFETVSECVESFGRAALPELKDRIVEKVEKLEKLDAETVDFVREYDYRVNETSSTDDNEHLAALIKEHRECEEVTGYMLSVMAYICKNEGIKEDDIYKLLRRAFKAFELRIIPTICLVDYGDWRAIALLRSTVEKEGRDMDEAEVREMLVGIINLGGDITGLPGADSLGVSSLDDMKD